MIGVNLPLYMPDHSLPPEARNGIKGPEWALPITIGEDGWVGSSITVVPGVTIGDGTTIGAGSVVTKDIPARSVAAGNPARVIKTIDIEGNLQPVTEAQSAIAPTHRTCVLSGTTKLLESCAIWL